MRVNIAALALCILVLSTANLVAQVPRSMSQKMGLESAWKSQVRIPVVGRGIVSSHLWADNSSPREFAVVELPDRTIRVAASMPDRKGMPIGLEEAKAQAKKKAALVLGKNDGFQVVEQSIPELRLVVITSDGLAQCMDAETGKLIWATACGSSSAPAHPGAVSPAGVTVVHGRNLYLLDWTTGKQVFSTKLREATANAVAVCNDLAFVSDYAGRVQAYGLVDKRKPWRYVMHGRTVGHSVTLANQTFSAVATDRGFVYVFSGAGDPSVYIRYETTSPLTGSLSAGNGAFYAGSTGGLISKISVDDRLGQVKWEFRMGIPITASPLVVGSQVFVAAESGSLVSINDNTGIANWTNPLAGVERPVSVCQNTLFCISTAGALTAIDTETGEVMQRSVPLNLSHSVLNQLNDRIYVVAKSGAIQCLRRVGADLPSMFADVPAFEQEDESTPQTQENTTVAAAAAQTAGSPFNFDSSAGDPFNTTAPAEGDPFGGAGGDPFGGLGGTSEEDPFGFGGGGN